MDIFRSVTQTVLGGPQTTQQTSEADNIHRLIDRVQSSTLLEDRREGCRALKAVSRKSRVLVGAHGMDVLIQVLESDRGDHEIVNYAINTLINITSNEVFPEEIEENGEGNPSVDANIGEQFTEIFTKRSENISLVLGLLDEFDFKVRYPAIKLLTNLLTNRPKDLQEAILVIPSGVSKLMDLLSDSREVIRNDMLLLLTQLTKNNTSLQKIVAFENAFDHLFEIIKDEGYSEGDVVVEDCLTLLLSLLTNNPSNQTFFKEGSYIQKLTSFFTAPLEMTDEGWARQKISNINYMLKLVRTLVSPQNPTQVVQACQKVMSQCGLLKALCGLLKPAGVPADILNDTLMTVSEIIRGDQANQDYFLSVMVPFEPPKSIILVLLMSMVDEKQPFSLRCSFLYCFECFLYKNQAGQNEIIQTSLSPNNEGGGGGAQDQFTYGQLLIGGIFSPDPISNWFSAVALSHALLDNPSVKEKLLRLQLIAANGCPSVSIFTQCVNFLQSSTSKHTKFGLLQLLSTWLAQYPAAVSCLLNIPSMVPYLLMNISANDHDELEVTFQGLCAFLLGLCAHFNDGSVPNYTKEALTQLVADRVGADNFTAKLNNVTNTENYSKAAKYPQIRAKDSSQLVFDHEFCRLLKSLESMALKAVTPQLNGNAELNSSEMLKYKEIIREQDEEMTKVKESLEQTKQQLQTLTQQNTDLNSYMTQIQQENNYYKSQLSTGNITNPVNPDVTQNSNDSNVDTDTRIQQLQQQLSEMTYARDYYYYQMVEKQNLLEKENNGSGTNTESGETSNTGTSTPDVENLQKQLQDLQLVLHDKDTQIDQLKEYSQQSTETSNNAAVVSNYESQLSSLKQEKNTIEQENLNLKEEISKLKIKMENLSNKESTQDEEISQSPRGSSSSNNHEDVETLKKDVEDLLVLLTDQDNKLSQYRKRLRALGESTSEDEEDLELDIQDDDLQDLK